MLKYGIESAPLTTDFGIDLVAYYPKNEKVTTIQVKTNLEPKPGGGTGKLSLDWWIPKKNPAKVMALVDMEKNRVWVFKKDELKKLPNLQSSKEKYHICMYTDPNAKPKGMLRTDKEFEQYLFDKRYNDLFY